MINTWLPGNQYYSFNTPATVTLGYQAAASGGQVICTSFGIPNAESGVGITATQFYPVLEITKPPKVCYSSTSDMRIVIQDSAGWNWISSCPVQATVKERGWSWQQFALHSSQENVGTLPSVPATGNIRAIQFAGADHVHGSGNDITQTISIAYIAGRSPVAATTQTVRTVTLTNKNPKAHTWKVGNMDLVGGVRTPVKYIGALPFGLQVNGPRNRLGPLPYKGPIVAGYQSGSPWISLSNNSGLSGMMDFMLESQIQFQNRHPDKILGPFMHIYLQALWDCEQNGEIDTWVWDGSDGNPAWDGWQYRAFEAMGRTWVEAKENPDITTENITKVETVATRFLDWLFDWLVLNPNAAGVPNDWKPDGWSQGNPLPPDSYLEPKYNAPSAHDTALAMKGALFCGVAGYNKTKATYVIHRCLMALEPLQVTEAEDAYMSGSFTLNPAGFEVYGFEQGEILEALALAKQHPELLTSDVST